MRMISIDFHVDEVDVEDNVGVAIADDDDGGCDCLAIADTSVK